MGCIKKLICLGLILFCSHTVLAESQPDTAKKKGDPKSVTLAGDSIVLDTEIQSVEASGNVAITYGVTVTADVFCYNPNSGELSFPQTFAYQSGKNKMTGKRFFYNVKTYKGQTEELKARIDRLQITGRKIDLMPLYIKIHDATFTSCDYPTKDQHYRVVARTLYVYPEFGYLVAFNSRVYVKYVPFSVPVPTFIYGSKRYGLTSVTSLLPDIGTNRTKGGYIEQKIPYFKSNNSNGGIILGFSEKLGTYAGAEHIQTINKHNSLELYGVQYSRDTFSGSATYHYIVGNNFFLDVGANILEKVLKNFNAGQSLPISQALISVKYRDIINDQRVSYLPMTQFEINKAPLAYLGLYCTSVTRFGKIREDQPGGKFTSLTGSTTLDLARDHMVAKGLELHSGVLYFGNWYEHDISWQRFYLQFGLQKKDILFKPQILYTQNVFQPRGDSPFLHEHNFALNGNEIGLRLEHKFERWKYWEITQVTDYSMETNQLRNCDFSVGYRFHCWQMSLRWRAVQQAFGLGFTIY